MARLLHKVLSETAYYGFRMRKGPHETYLSAGHFPEVLNETAHYDELTFTDDFLFGKILCDDPELCREFAEILLDRKISRIAVPEKQKPISVTPDGKGIRLDVFFEDDLNTMYNLEMQTTSSADLPRRCRYYQGMLDLNAMNKGAHYKNLKDSVIVFICTFDPFSCGRHRYTFKNRCMEEPSLDLKDGTLKVFINTQGKMNDVSQDLQKLLRSINGERCGSALGDRINQAVQKALLREEWKEDYMTLAMLLQDTRDEARKEGLEQGKKEGLEQGKKEGLEQGKKEEILRSVLNIMEGFRVSLEQAMNVQKLSAEEREYCRKALNPSAG